MWWPIRMISRPYSVWYQFLSPWLCVGMLKSVMCSMQYARATFSSCTRVRGHTEGKGAFTHWMVQTAINISYADTGVYSFCRCRTLKSESLYCVILQCVYLTICIPNRWSLQSYLVLFHHLDWFLWCIVVETLLLMSLILYLCSCCPLCLICIFVYIPHATVGFRLPIELDLLNY